MGQAYDRGLFLFNQKRFKQAADEFRRELAENNRLPVAHSMLGMSLLLDSDATAAEPEILLGLQLGPEEGYCHYATACLLLNHLFAQLEKKRRRRFAFTKPRNLVHEAKKHLLTAIELDPKKVSYFTLLAALEFDARKWDASITASQKGLELDPFNERTAILLARAYSQKRYLIEAGRILSRVLSDNPLCSDAHREYAWNLIDTGQPQHAADHFRESVRLNPMQPNTANLLLQARRLKRPLQGFRLRVSRAYARRVSPRARRYRFFIIYIGVVFAAQMLESKNETDSPLYSGALSIFLLLVVIRSIRNLLRRRR